MTEANGAPILQSALAQLGMELRLTARRGENLFVIVVLPLILLIFFAFVPALTPNTPKPIDFLLPGILALAVISTSLVNLSIATAFERSYGVLKRLGGSPLPRAGLIAAKIGAVVVVGVDHDAWCAEMVRQMDAERREIQAHGKHSHRTSHAARECSFDGAGEGRRC